MPISARVNARSGLKQDNGMRQIPNLFREQTHTVAFRISLCLREDRCCWKERGCTLPEFTRTMCRSKDGARTLSFMIVYISFEPKYARRSPSFYTHSGKLSRENSIFANKCVSKAKCVKIIHKRCSRAGSHKLSALLHLLSFQKPLSHNQKN